MAAATVGRFFPVQHQHLGATGAFATFGSLLLLCADRWSSGCGDGYHGGCGDGSHPPGDDHGPDARSNHHEHQGQPAHLRDQLWYE